MAMQPQSRARSLADLSKMERLDGYEKTNSTNVKVDKTIATLVDIIATTLTEGDNVTLVGFDTFEVRKRAARAGRNPQTGAAIKIKASKAPAFKVGATA